MNGIKNEKQEIARISFIGPFQEDEVKKQLSQHILFSKKEINIIKKEYASELKDGLENGEFEYVIVPCRNEKNEINVVMMDMVSSMVSRGYIEIGSYYVKQAFHEKKKHIQDDEFVDHDPIYTYNQSQYAFSSNGKITEYFEYKIFKRSTYHSTFFERLFIFLFADGLLSKILAFILVIAAFVFILLGFALGKEILDQISLWISLSAACFQFVIYILDLKEKARMRLISGYWIYYSFEERKSSSFVPKGFKTRIMEINHFNSELSMTCKIEGEDSIFFSTSDLTFSYNPHTRVGKGFYEYITNIRNNAGKRAEGVCRYQGKREKNEPFFSMDGWFSSRGTEITGRVKYIRVSKEEYNLLQKSNGYYANQFHQDSLLNIGIYGDECSNTDIVAKKYIQHLEKEKEICYVYFDHIDRMHEDFQHRKIDIAIVPEKNRGKLIKSNQCFAQNESSFKVEEVEEEVQYILVSSKKNYHISKETIFIGHPQSLEQCASFIKNHKKLIMSSSSRAARELKYFANPENYVAICNETARKYYHLYPVKDKNGNLINPYKEKMKNITTFSIYRH